MCCCKYCSKHGKRKGQAAALYEVLDGMESKDASAREHFGEGHEATKLGSKLCRACMTDTGEELCQNEVAHHTSRRPDHLGARPETCVHLCKTGLSIGVPSATREGGALGRGPVG